MCPTPNLELLCSPLKHITKCYLPAFRTLPEIVIPSLPGKPFAMPHIFTGEIFLSTECKPFLSQLKATSSSLVTCYLGEELFYFNNGTNKSSAGCQFQMGKFRNSLSYEVFWLGDKEYSHSLIFFFTVTKWLWYEFSSHFGDT